MKRSLEFRPVALTILVALTVTYVLCVAAGALFGWATVLLWFSELFNSLCWKGWASQQR